MKKAINKQIEKAVAHMEEMKQIVLSVCEDVLDAKSMTEAWDKVDRCYQDLEALRNRQKCTGAKSFSILTDDVPGHTKFLQGIHLPIMVNSIIEGKELKPSNVCEMHVGTVDGVETLLITPDVISESVRVGY